VTRYRQTAEAAPRWRRGALTAGEPMDRFPGRRFADHGAEGVAGSRNTGTAAPGAETRALGGKTGVLVAETTAAREPEHPPAPAGGPS